MNDITPEERAGLRGLYAHWQSFEAMWIIRLLDMLEAAEHRLMELDDIQQCKDGLYYCAWAEHLVGERDEARRRLATVLEKAVKLWHFNKQPGEVEIGLKEIIALCKSDSVVFETE